MHQIPVTALVALDLDGPVAVAARADPTGTVPGVGTSPVATRAASSATPPPALLATTATGSTAMATATSGVASALALVSPRASSVGPASVSCPSTPTSASPTVLPLARTLESEGSRCGTAMPDALPCRPSLVITPGQVTRLLAPIVGAEQ